MPSIAAGLQPVAASTPSSFSTSPSSFTFIFITIIRQMVMLPFSNFTSRKSVLLFHHKMSNSFSPQSATIWRTPRVEERVPHEFFSNPRDTTAPQRRWAAITEKQKTDCLVNRLGLGTCLPFIRTSTPNCTPTRIALVVKKMSQFSIFLDVFKSHFEQG